MKTIQEAKKVECRKSTRCNYCNGAIVRGLKYFRSTHLHEDEIYTWKAHSGVDDARSWVNEWCDRESKKWRIFREKQLENEAKNIQKDKRR